MYVGHRKDVYSAQFVKDNPPAIYDVREVAGKDKKAISIHGRLPMFTKKMSEVTKENPGPIYDINDRKLYGMKGLHERSFGFG